MLLVHVVQRFERFMNYVPDDGLRELGVQSCIEELGQAPSVHVLQKDPKPILVEVTVDVPDYILMVADSHESDLVPHALLLLGCLHGSVHVLERILLGRVLFLLIDQVDLSVTTTAYELFDAVIESWIVEFEEILMLEKAHVV